MNSQMLCLLDTFSNKIEKTKESNLHLYGSSILSVDALHKFLFGSIDPETAKKMCPVIEAYRSFTLVAETHIAASDIEPAHLFLSIPGTEYPELLYENSPKLTHLHRHNFYELIYVPTGQYVVEIEGKKTYIRSNEVCLLDSNCRHTDISTECTGTIFYLQIDQHIIDDYFINSLLPGDWRNFMIQCLHEKSSANYLSKHLSADDADQVDALYASIYNEINAAMLGHQRVVQAYFLRIIQILDRDRKNQLSTASVADRTFVSFKILSEFIHLHLATVDIPMLVKEFHYQEDYFNRLIKKHTGHTFSAYVQNLRIERSKELLLTTDLSVREIALQLNYSCESYFYRQFKDAVGITPRQFRKNCKGISINARQ